MASKRGDFPKTREKSPASTATTGKRAQLSSLALSRRGEINRLLRPRTAVAARIFLPPFSDSENHVHFDVAHDASFISSLSWRTRASSDFFRLGVDRSVGHMF
jgi:hypothetical protein